MEEQKKPFISFEFLTSYTYTPSYHWNDDDRDTKDIITYYDDRISSYKDEYIPVYQIMKEYYDEQKYELCSNSSQENSNYQSNYKSNYKYCWEEYETDTDRETEISIDASNFSQSDDESTNKDSTDDVDQLEVEDTVVDNKFVYI